MILPILTVLIISLNGLPHWNPQRPSTINFSKFLKEIYISIYISYVEYIFLTYNMFSVNDAFNQKIDHVQQRNWRTLVNPQRNKGTLYI